MLEQYQSSNPQLLQRVQTGQIQRTFIDFRVEGGKVHVSENVQFKREMEQNIISHFNFMLRVSFYSGVFDEIETFVQIYQRQFEQSTQLFEMWKEVDLIISNISSKISHAQGRLREIENYNNSGVIMQEFNDLKKTVHLVFLNDEFAKESALKNQNDEKQRAAFTANAQTSLEEGTIYLQWLQLQKQRQIKFQQDLNQITALWNEDYQVFEAGKQFVQSINLNQIAIYNEKDWDQGSWAKQLRTQMDIANPFFANMYKKYLVCFKFYQDLEELNQLVRIRQDIQNVKIEIAIREAEKPFLEAFLAYFRKQLKTAQKELILFLSNDKIDRLQECQVNMIDQVRKVEGAFNNLDVRLDRETTTIRYVSSIGNTHVTHTTVDIRAVTDVHFQKDSINLNFINPYDIKYSKETLEQMEEVKKLEAQIEWFLEELRKLQRAYLRLQQLNEEPERIQLQFANQFQQKILDGDILIAQFQQLLQQCQMDNYDYLYYGQQSMTCLMGALSKFVVIKKNACCMCCSKKQLHETDDLFFEDYEKSVASEIRTIINATNKWCTSNQQRIQQTNQLPVVRSGTKLILNNYILSSLRKDDGHKQFVKGERVFDVNASIVYTINELCQLAIIDQKLKMNLQSPTTQRQMQNWQQSYQDAKDGLLASNQILPLTNE